MFNVFWCCGVLSFSLGLAKKFLYNLSNNIKLKGVLMVLKSVIVSDDGDDQLKIIIET